VLGLLGRQQHHHHQQQQQQQQEEEEWRAFRAGLQVLAHLFLKQQGWLQVMLLQARQPPM
jgi:hypothetical protein